MIPRTNLAFRDVIPVSTITGLGLDKLKRRLRGSLDEEASKGSEPLHRERLGALRPGRTPLPVWGI